MSYSLPKPSATSSEEQGFTMDRNMALEAVRITEAAALAASRWLGRGEEKSADAAAVEAMRNTMNSMDIDGTVVIGEGERDKAPMLYIGEQVGTKNGAQVDIALDPLEGTTTCANGGFNSIAVLAMASKGGFLHAPDVYMDKIAVGAGLPKDVIDLDATPKENLTALAKAKKCDISDLVVCVLDRERHQNLISDIRAAGARILLISDGDVTGIIATTSSDSAIDIYMGTGGAPEGVLAAAALRCIGGQMQGRLIFHDDGQRERAKRMGIEDLDKKYTMQEMAKGEVMFAATGVTDGPLLKGVHRMAGGAKTHSIIMRSKTGTVRDIHAHHNFNRKTWVDSEE